MIVWAKMRSGEPLLEIHVGRFIFQSQRVNKNFSLRHCHRIDNCTLLAHLLAASNLSGQCEISGQVNGPPVKMQIIPLWTLMRGLHHSRILLNRNRIDTGRDRDWDGTPLWRMQECVTKDPQIVVFSSQREFSCHTTLFLFRETMTALFDRGWGYNWKVQMSMAYIPLAKPRFGNFIILPPSGSVWCRGGCHRSQPAADQLIIFYEFRGLRRRSAWVVDEHELCKLIRIINDPIGNLLEL